MPEIKNTFLKSRMNKDTEARILPKNEYRDAQNANVSASEDASVGSLENVRGNKLLTNLGLTDYNIEIIGQYADTVNNRIFFFLTNFTDASADSLGNLSKPSATAGGSGDYTNFARTGANNYIAYCQLPNVADSSAIEQSNISFSILLSGTFLNFSKTHPISGINIIENLLFFTDNRNQPRKINVDNAIANPLIYYTNEDHISVAKYAPYEPISFLKNTSGALESTLINEYDEWLPAFWGAPGQILSTVTPNVLIFNENTASDPANESYSTISDYLGTGNLSFEVKVTSAKDPNGSFAYIQDIDTGTSPAKIKLKSNQGPATPIPINDIAAELAWTTNTVFLFSIKNPKYNASFSGDKKLLEDKFVRFSYRFKYDDNEYSLAAPFTQHAFVPKQYGYFLEGDDEKTKASSIVEFMENQITTVGLVINLPYKSNEFAEKLKVNEIQLLYKASDDLNVKVIADVKVSDLSGSPSSMSLKTAGSNYTTGTLINKATTGGSGSGLTVDLVIDGAGRSTSATVNKTGEGYKVGDVVSISSPLGGTDAEYTVTSLNSTYIYNYSSEKPIKVLTDEEITRVSDIVPMRAQTQEIVGNRVVYGNFLQNNATPLSLDYRLETTTKGSLSNSNTNKEFLNNTLKQNRSYQVGLVLQDRYGRASNVIINQLDLLTKNSTIFNSYTNGGTNPLAWSGDALKVVFNSQIPSELSSSLPYNGLWKENENPLGWYTYKIVVQQQEQDYYNIYVPGALSGNIIYNKNGTATPASFEGLQYSSTSSVASIALFNDNINKIPRDLKEVGPTDNVYGSSVILYNRVKQNIFNPTVGSNPVSTQANVTISEQNISPLKQEVSTVRPFSELGDWTNKKNIDLHYANMDQNSSGGSSSSQYGLGSFIYPGLVGDVDPFFLRNNKNPLIATISTQKRMGFTSTNQEKGQWNFADKLMVFETRPFKSNIDIYYETSTTGIISELNNSILTSEASGITNAPAGLSSVNITNWFESSIVGQSISNVFEVINSQGSSQAGSTALTTNVKIIEITNSLSSSIGFVPISKSNWPIEIVQVSAPVAPNVGPKFQLVCRRRIIFQNGSNRADNYNITFEISTDTFTTVQVTVPAVKLSNITPTIYRMSTAWPTEVDLEVYGVGSSFNTWVKSQDPNTFLNSNSNNQISSVVNGNTGVSYSQEVNAIWIKNNEINDFKNAAQLGLNGSNASIFRFQSLTNGYDVVSAFDINTDSQNIDPNINRLKGLKYKIFNVKKYKGRREKYDNPDDQDFRLKPIKYYKFNDYEEDVTDQFSITLSEFPFSPLPSGVTPVSYVVTMNANALPIRDAELNWASLRRSCYVYVIQVQCTDASDGTDSLASSVYTLNFIITK